MLTGTVDKLAVTDRLVKLNIDGNNVVGGAVSRAPTTLNGDFDDHLMFSGIDIDVDDIARISIRAAESADANVDAVVFWTH